MFEQDEQDICLYLVMKVEVQHESCGKCYCISVCFLCCFFLCLILWLLQWWIWSKRWCDNMKKPVLTYVKIYKLIFFYSSNSLFLKMWLFSTTCLGLTDHMTAIKAWIFNSGKSLYYWTFSSLLFYLHDSFQHDMVWVVTMVIMVRHHMTAIKGKS